MKRSIRTFLGVLIAAALLGAYGIAARNGPKGEAPEVPAGFAH
jgi:hypothetical protein